MLDFLNKYAGNVHSQNGEDLILREVLNRLGLTTGLCVEIGGADGRWMSNTRLLIENGWAGKFVETEFRLWELCRDNWADNPKVQCICSHADKYNINAFVKDDCDLLSLDTDGSDFDLWAAILAKPKIVIVEIDSSIPPDRNEFNSEGGAGYLPMLRLGREKGYFLLCHTGNMIFLRSEYWATHFPEITAHPEVDAGLYFNRAWIKAAA